MRARGRRCRIHARTSKTPDGSSIVRSFFVVVIFDRDTPLKPEPSVRPSVQVRRKYEVDRCCRDAQLIANDVQTIDERSGERKLFFFFFFSCGRAWGFFTLIWIFDRWALGGTLKKDARGTQHWIPIHIIPRPYGTNDDAAAAAATFFFYYSIARMWWWCRGQGQDSHLAFIKKKKKKKKKFQKSAVGQGEALAGTWSKWKVAEGVESRLFSVVCFPSWSAAGGGGGRGPARPLESNVKRSLWSFSWSVYDVLCDAKKGDSFNCWPIVKLGKRRPQKRQLLTVKLKLKLKPVLYSEEGARVVLWRRRSTSMKWVTSVVKNKIALAHGPRISAAFFYRRRENSDSQPLAPHHTTFRSFLRRTKFSSFFFSF